VCCTWLLTCGVVRDLDTPCACQVSLRFAFGVPDVVDACVRCATCAVNPPPCCSLFPSPQAVRTAVTDLYARHVNQVAEDKTVPSDTRPAVSDAEMEKEFGRQVGGPHLIESLYRLKPHHGPCVRGGGHVDRRKTSSSFSTSTAYARPTHNAHPLTPPHHTHVWCQSFNQRAQPFFAPVMC
jgi:hypothetical protein